MSDFKEVIVEKINELVGVRNKIVSTAMDSNFHSSKIRDAVQGVIPQINDHPGDVDELKVEIVSILNQLPDLVQSVWTDIANEISKVDREASQYREMLSLYTEWEKENAPQVEPQPAELSEEKKAAIASGEIQEPSKMTAIRRKPGERPPITLGQYRREKSGSGEESET